MKAASFIILMHIVIAYWWVCLVYSRHQTARLEALKRAKYAVWDEAYKKSLQAGNAEYQAVADAVRAVNAGAGVMQVWKVSYEQAIKSGIRRYKAGVRASAVAREAAHRR
jgi:hypothetical protein